MKKVKGSDFFCGELFPESTSVEKTEALPNTYDWGDLFERLSQSRFRSKFRLTTKEIVYLKEKGEDTIARHAADFIRKRLAPAVIPNDGKQSHARASRVYSSTCHRVLLPRLFRKMASYTGRSRIDR